MAPYIERAIAERALEQLGHITFRQIRALGATAKVVNRLVESGWLTPVGRSTFRLGGVARTYEGDVMAACLDVGAVASHRTGACLHGLGPKAWRQLPLEVSVVKRRRHTESDLARIHTTTNLGPDDIVPLRGVPTTSVARTIFGLAALVPEVTEEDLRDLVDIAIRDGRASDAWLWWRLDQLRCRGRNGVSVLEAILADRDGKGRTESWLERAFLDCLDEVGFPHPKVQQRIRHANGMVARVDFLYEPNTVIEVLGYRWHSTHKQTQADAARRNRLILEGYGVLEFTYGQVVETPHVVWCDLAERLGFAMPVLLSPPTG
jgi:putative AbiEi antitoxin of type IV toxin-antitoxin system